MLKHCILVTILYFTSITTYAQFEADGGSKAPFRYSKNIQGTGIENIYMFNTFTNAVLKFTSKAPVVKFYSYTYSIADKELIPNQFVSVSYSGSEKVYSISNLMDSKGYFAEVNGNPTASVWIIDYSKHLPILNAIKPIEENDKCGIVSLEIDKDDALHFYANNGSKHPIIREYELEYLNLEWNDENKEFDEKTIIEGPFDVGSKLVLNAPLMDTKFSLKGDQIAKYFQIKKSIESITYKSVATDPHIKMEQLHHGSEEDTSDKVGGSAPAEVFFYGISNEPSTHFYTWYIYKKPNTQQAIARYTDKNIRFLFKEEGDYLIVLETANRNSECISEQSEELSISEFWWDIPNFLLLDGTSSFKISYKSVLNFRAAIFNRWGNKIYEWTDPSEGWDGKYKGKYVKPGVYFYIITAKSGDGKKHQKSGDINVLIKK